ncbi:MULTISPECIES: S24 family peptidase [Vibrio]|uniref:S24 family peptidase n=1 Tax=Vibrio cyclitrophicus TaxID=47951 RepID=A0ACD5G5X3_9VIBR|nr:S24 family peptidase [Vibrio cyclitrophicus]
MLWIITGQNYTQANWLTPNQSIEICRDNSMTPTFTELTPVIIETIKTEQPIHNGVYCIGVTQGIAFRRLQWDEERQGFWLRCDNLHFEPQFSQAPNVIGKVVGAVMPVL